MFCYVILDKDQLNDILTLTSSTDHFQVPPTRKGKKTAKERTYGDNRLTSKVPDPKSYNYMKCSISFLQQDSAPPNLEYLDYLENATTEKHRIDSMVGIFQNFRFVFKNVVS